jgi:hypothetical protein
VVTHKGGEVLLDESVAFSARDAGPQDWGEKGAVGWVEIRVGGLRGGVGV